MSYCSPGKRNAFVGFIVINVVFIIALVQYPSVYTVFEGANKYKEFLKQMSDLERSEGKNSSFSSNEPLAQIPSTSIIREAASLIITNTQENHSHNLSEPWASVQQHRRNNLKEMCNKFSGKDELGIKPHLRNQLYQDALLVDQKHKVVYCSVPKVACTSWKTAMAQLSGKPEAYDTEFVRDIHNSKVLAHFGLKTFAHYNKTEQDYFLQHYTKFMTVRHPLERLLSAWRDKFHNYNHFTEFFQHRYGKQIINKYREKPSVESLKRGHDVSFHEFLRYLLDDENFSQHFRMNPHWTPFSILCDPCKTKFDYIVRYETISEDTDFILRNVYGVKNTTSFFPRRTAGKTPTKTILGENYNLVDKEVLRKIVDFFKQDFLLFEYHLA